MHGNINIDNAKIETNKNINNSEFDANDISGMTIDGKTFEIKSIKGYSKEVVKLTGYLKQLEKEAENIEMPKLKQPQIEQPKLKISGYRGNTSKNVNSDVNSFNLWDTLRTKIEQIKPAIQQFMQSLKGVGTNSKELELVKYKISEIEEKLEKAKNGEIHLNTKQIIEAEAQLERLNNKKQKLEGGNKGNFFSSFFSSLKKVTPSISNVAGITIKIKNTIKQWNGGLKNGLGHVLKYASALFGLRTIYTTLSNCASSWLSSQNAQAQQLSANIDYMKYAMGSVFAPVIKYVTNLVYNLMKAVQSLVYAFSGVNIFAKATANSMNSASGSASKASKSLAGIHNEINNVSDNDSSGGSSGTSPSIDLSQMDNTPNSIIEAIKSGNWYEVGATIAKKLNEAMDKIPWDTIHSKASQVGKNIADFINGGVQNTNWDKVGNTVAQGINTAIYFAKSLINNTNFSDLGQAIGTTIASTIKNIDWENFWQTLVDAITGLVETLNGILIDVDYSEAQDSFVNGLFNIDLSKLSEALFRLIGWILGETIALLSRIKLYEYIYKYLIEPSIENAKEDGENIILGLLKGLGDAILGIGQWIYENIFAPFIDGFKSAFGIHSPSKVMEEQGNFIMQGLLNGITDLVDNVKEIWENIKNTAVQKFTDIKTSISDIWQQVKSKTSETWQNIKDKVKEGVQEAWNGITSIFGNIPNWFRDKFSQAWQAVKNVFSTGGKIFDGIKEGILSGLKSIVNAIITGINKVIRVPFNGINSALRAIKNVNIMGLTPFSWISTISVPQIPKLAKGNVAYDETLAIFGEYSGASNNPEITTPQNIMRETFEDVLSDFNGNNGQPLHVTIQYLGKEIFDDTIEYINSKTRRTGKNTIVTVGG